MCHDRWAWRCAICLMNIQQLVLRVNVLAETVIYTLIHYIYKRRLWLYVKKLCVYDAVRSVLEHREAEQIVFM